MANWMAATCRPPALSASSGTVRVTQVVKATGTVPLATPQATTTRPAAQTCWPKISHALEDSAFADSLDFKLWTILQGWETFDRARPLEPATVDSLADPLTALNAITAMGQTNNLGFADLGILVMMHPHKPLSQNIAMIQIVKDYAKWFPASQRRLVIVTLFGYAFPISFRTMSRVQSRRRGQATSDTLPNN